MNRSQLAFLILIVLSFVSCQSWNDNLKGVKLDEEEFKKQVGGDDNVVVLFYTPWCSYSKAVLGEYNKLSSQYENQDQETQKSIYPQKKTQIAHLNCEEYKDLCKKEGVTGYPTIVIYPANDSGKVVYKGERTAESINSWIKEQIRFDGNAMFTLIGIMCALFLIYRFFGPRKQGQPINGNSRQVSQNQLEIC